MQFRWVGAALLIGVLAGCGKPDRAKAAEHSPAGTTPICSLRPPPEDGQWVMAAKDPYNSRVSGLRQITPENAGQLKRVWSHLTGMKKGHEAAPRVVGDTMYVVTPLPNILMAFDLKSPDGRVKWIYDPHVAKASAGVACCDVVKRGAVYSNGKIIYNLLDMHTVAVDAVTGKEIWRTTLGDIATGETMTMAPIVAEGQGAGGRCRR